MSVKAKQVTFDEWADHLNAIPHVHATEHCVSVMTHVDGSGKAHGAVIYTEPKIYVILEHNDA